MRFSATKAKRGYRPKQAHQKALARRKKGISRISLSDRSLIERLLILDWSPEPISLDLNEEQLLQVSHEWIYQHIYKTNEWEGSYGNISEARKSGQIPDRVWIDERPAEVAGRQRLGDWEADTIISQGR